MIRFLARLVADNRAEVHASDLLAEGIAARPLVECGFAVFSRHDTDGYRCPGCYCSGHPVVYSDTPPSGGRTRFIRLCPEDCERTEIAPDDIAVYTINPLAVTHMIAREFGCGDASPIAGFDGAWNLGQSATAIAKHRRRILFMRRIDERLAESLVRTQTIGKGAIAIAAYVAPGEWQNDSIAIFPMADVFICDDGGLWFDPDAIVSYFEERTSERRQTAKNARKHDKEMLVKMTLLANHLKTLATPMLRLVNRDSESAYDELVAAQKSVSKPSLAEYFESADAACRISRTALYGYLDAKMYKNLPQAEAARFWFSVCTDHNSVVATADLFASKQTLRSKMMSIDKQDAVELYQCIQRYLVR